MESVTGIGSEKPGKVLWSGERSGVEHRALSEFPERNFVGCSGFPWMSGGVPEVGFALGQAVGFQLNRFAGGILADKDEVSIVSDQNLAIFAPVAAYLLAIGGEPSIARGGLDFDDTASRVLRKRFFLAALFELVFGKEAEVRAACATVFQLRNAPNFWFHG